MSRVSGGPCRRKRPNERPGRACRRSIATRRADRPNEWPRANRANKTAGERRPSDWAVGSSGQNGGPAWKLASSSRARRCSWARKTSSESTARRQPWACGPAGVNASGAGGAGQVLCLKWAAVLTTLPLPVQPLSSLWRQRSSAASVRSFRCRSSSSAGFTLCFRLGGRVGRHLPSRGGGGVFCRSFVEELHAGLPDRLVRHDDGPHLLGGGRGQGGGGVAVGAAAGWGGQWGSGRAERGREREKGREGESNSENEERERLPCGRVHAGHTETRVA